MRIVGELTADGRNIILMANGADWELAHATAAMQLCTPLIKRSKPPGALVLPATWPAVVQLAETFGPNWAPGVALTEWVQHQVRIRTPSAGDTRVAIPQGLCPRDYQVEAARMIAANGRVLLFDEAGTGKTISTILGICERACTTTVLPVLVVCPASVVDNWIAEFRKWAPQFWTEAWRGSKKARRNLIGQSHVFVCSYETARNDASSTEARDGNPLIELNPKFVVADECHRMKGHQSQQSRAVRRLAERADNFVGLSGTPITHHPGDLWPVLVGLEPGAWPSRERWINRYCLSVPGDYDVRIVGLHPGFEPEFRTTLIGRHRRVAKADVLSQLPPKVYTVHTVDLPTAYRKSYDDMESRMLADLPDGGELSVMSVLAQLTRLSQLACAAADVETTHEWDETLQDYREHQKVTLKAPSWKVDELLEIMEERPGKSIVCFAPSRQLVVLAGAAAQSAGYRVGYVVGGQSAKERTANVDAFQHGETDLLCATTGAGGVGLTLTAAGTCVFLQRPWSLVEALQAEDRLHRIGSEVHASIEILDIVASKTIDTRVRTVLKGKAGQLSDILQDPRIVSELLGGNQLRKKVSA